MHALTRLLDRLVPALLIAASVTLLTAGLLSYTSPAFGDWQTVAPGFEDDPLFSATPPAAASGGPTTSPGASGSPPASLDPGATSLPTIWPPYSTPLPGTSPFPTTPGGGFATRIHISSFRIDLPVVPSDYHVPGNRNNYPLCDVAMYMRGYMAPGQEGATYIYAHAQRGMFWNLLVASKRDDGAAMIGSLVEVYTSDNRLHLYEIYRVKRHATDLSLANNVPDGQHILVLQTSEGPSGTVPKLQIAARPLSVVAATSAEANPRPRPRICQPH